MKSIIKRLFNYFGVEIKKLDKELKNNITFDEIYQLNFKKNPIIFDIGANRGQSIKRFNKIFNKPIIHAFEPNYDEYMKLYELYGDKKNIYLNNFAIGEKNYFKNFNISLKSDTSSFYKFKNQSKWILKRAKDLKVHPKKFVKRSVKTRIITLDKYCRLNNIGNIDILKIDTQGYEANVLEGAKEILKKNLISALEIEIILDNVYEVYNSFSDIEKNLIKNNYRLVALDKGGDGNSNLFEGLVFFCDLVYFSKKQLNKKLIK